MYMYTTTFLIQESCINRSKIKRKIFDSSAKGLSNYSLTKKPLHFREIQWGIYNTSSLKCNGFLTESFAYILQFHRVNSTWYFNRIYLHLKRLPDKIDFGMSYFRHGFTDYISNLNVTLKLMYPLINLLSLLSTNTRDGKYSKQLRQ